MLLKDEKERVQSFFQSKNLPIPHLKSLESLYGPLWEKVLEGLERKNPFVMGFSGAPGSGKSTLVELMRILLEDKGFRVGVLSVDDFIFPLHKRIRLSKELHPLFYRCSAGSLDTELLEKSLEKMITLEEGYQIKLIRFSKLTSDRVDIEKLPMVKGSFDIIFFEGFCLSVPPETEDSLTKPINSFEAEWDKDIFFRKHVNENLKQMEISFSKIDYLVYLSVDSFLEVVKNRYRTEINLSRESSTYSPMNFEEIKKHMRLHERIIERQRICLPSLSQLILPVKEF